jgi:hypothetical protein
VQLAANGQVPVPLALAGYTGTLLAGALVAWALLRGDVGQPVHTTAARG